MSALGRLDVWVNNAGVYPTHEALDMEPEDWDRVLDIDLRGVFLGARVAARRMVELGSGGVIVNVASTAAYRVAGRGIAHYAAAKHGVLGLTKSLAVELGPNGIRVLAVAPCVTATPGIEDARRAMEAAGFAIERLGERAPARSHRRSRRHRPRRPVLRLRSGRADDGQHAARRRRLARHLTARDRKG